MNHWNLFDPTGTGDVCVSVFLSAKMSHRARRVRMYAAWRSSWRGRFIAEAGKKTSINGWFWMIIWLLVWLPFLKCSYSVGIFIIPIDELIFFRGVAQPPTSYEWLWIMCVYQKPIGDFNCDVSGPEKGYSLVVCYTLRNDGSFSLRIYLK